MTATYYMDVNIPLSITTGLRRRQIDVLTSQDDGSRTLADELLVQRATELGRVFVSHDTDVLKIAKQWQESARQFQGCVFVRQEGLSIGRCIDDLELIAHCCLPEELFRQILFVPLI